jgi:hypothetical protein
MKALVENCKKTLGQMGVKLEDLFKSDDKEEKSAEDLVKETKKYDKPKTKEQVKPIKIVYKKSKDLKTEKPTNNKGGNNGKDKKNFKKSY